MYEDIIDGLKIGGDFSVEAITEFFDSTSERLFIDCKDCTNDEQDIIPEIRTAALSIREGFNYLNYQIIISLLIIIKNTVKLVMQ